MAQPKIRTDIPLESKFTNAPKEQLSQMQGQVDAQVSQAKDAEKRAFATPKPVAPPPLTPA